MDNIGAVKLWAPSHERREGSVMYRWMREAGQFADYDALHRWSVGHYPDFWRSLLDWSGILYEGDPEPAVVDPRMPGAQFFPAVSLNFAENLPRFDGPETALLSVCEHRPPKRLTYAELRHAVARLQ